MHASLLAEITKVAEPIIEPKQNVSNDKALSPPDLDTRARVQKTLAEREGFEPSIRKNRITV